MDKHKKTAVPLPKTTEMKKDRVTTPVFFSYGNGEAPCPIK